jgi:hypothetical protein
MTFEIKSEDVDVQEIMRSIRQRIEEKKRGLYTEDEIREIAEHRLNSVLQAHEFESRLLPELLAESQQADWDLRFGAETIFESSKSRLLERVRRLLRPIQKLFWNPGPMIWSIAHQSTINHDLYRRLRPILPILHNLAVEVTRHQLELQEHKNRILQLQGRLEQLSRREKTLEDMVVYRSDVEPAEPSGGGPKDGSS